MMRSFLLLISFYIGTLWSLNPEQIDYFAEETLQKWEIPGISLVVIQPGEKAYIKGYGFRERNSHKHVDAQTLFQINSLTKAFTALTVNMLVKEGKINWDAPINLYFPTFDPIDPQAKEQLSLRDLLCHRSGFPGNLYEGWRLFVKTDRPVNEYIQRLAFIEPIFPFRTRFNYDNIGYAIGSDIVAKASGVSWADFCQQKIFAPLGMNRTFISYSIYSKDENSALPHACKLAQPLPGYNWEKDSLEAASGINSCAADMALWLHYCLTQDSYFDEILKPHMIVNPEDLLPQTELSTFEIISHGQPQLNYALGWWLYNLDNSTIYRHTGSSPGMQSVLAIVPEKGLGVVILSNQAKHPAVSALMNQILDGLLDRPESDWQNLAMKAFLEVKENEKKWFESQALSRQEEIPPTFPLNKYAGIYTHPGYGSLLIKEKDQKLDIEFLFCNEKGHLQHWEGNQFEIVDMLLTSLKPFLCEFLSDEKNENILGLKFKDMGTFERR